MCYISNIQKRSNACQNSLKVEVEWSCEVLPIVWQSQGFISSYLTNFQFWLNIDMQSLKMTRCGFKISVKQWQHDILKYVILFHLYSLLSHMPFKICVIIILGLRMSQYPQIAQNILVRMLQEMFQRSMANQKHGVHSFVSFERDSHVKLEWVAH